METRGTADTSTIPAVAPADDLQPLRWNILAEASRAFAEASLNLQDLLDTITRHISALNQDLCVIRLLSDDGEWLVPVSQYHPEPQALEMLAPVFRPDYQRAGEGFHGRVVATNTPLLIPVIEPEEIRAAVRQEWFAYLDHYGISSMLLVPLRGRGRVIGSLGVFRSDRHAPYTVADQILIQDLADRAALAVDNARLYQQVVERERQLQELVGQLITAQEEERRRVAYDIHDGLAQIAVGTHQHLQAFSHRYRPRAAQARTDLYRALELSRQTIREARRVIANLRPTALDDFGLATALRLQLDELRADGWEIDYRDELGDTRLPAALETALFRVTQEALTNVRKHAATRRVRVTLTSAGDSVRLEVRDDGRGFDPARVQPGHGISERVGLAGMRERIALVGGTCTISSTLGTGTTVTVDVPGVAALAGLEQEAEDRDAG
jgi:signal transduction histidine kinase